MAELMQEKKVNTNGAKSAQITRATKIVYEKNGCFFFVAKFKLTPDQIELCGKSFKKIKIVFNVK